MIGPVPTFELLPARGKSADVARFPWPAGANVSPARARSNCPV